MILALAWHGGVACQGWLEYFNLKALRKSGDGSDMDGADAGRSRRVPKWFP